MSYCMFENTARDLGDVVNRIDQAFYCGGPKPVVENLDLNEYEALAFHDLAAQCEAYLAHYAELQEFIKVNN